jgi:PAS domain S-box-containing protein
MKKQFERFDQVVSEDQLLDSFFSISLDLFCVIGTDRKFKKVNPAFTSVLGYSNVELLSKSFFEIIHPEELTFIQYEFERLSHSKLSTHFENRCRSENGLFKILSWTVALDIKTGFLYASARDITEQRARESELKQTFNALSESAIVVRSDAQGKITEINELFSKISGYSSDEIMGKDHRILNSGYHSKEFFKNMWFTITNGNVWSGEIKNKAKNGSFYWVRAVITPIKDFQNKITSYISVRFDITAEKNTEHENRFVLDTLGLGIWRFNPVSQELHWDKSMYDLFEINQSEFSGHYQAWESSLTIDAKAKAVEELGQALRGEKEFDTVFAINTKSKGKCYIGGRGKVIRDSAGKPVIMYGVNWDTTKSKLDEEKLASKEKLLSTILDILPVAVFMKDIKNDYRWTIWNKHAENLFGLPAKVCLGKNDGDIFPKEQAEFFRLKDIEASKSIGVVDIPEEPAKTAHGPAILRTRKVVIRNDSDEPVFLLGITENITESKKQQQKLQTQAQELKTLFHTMTEGMVLQDCEGKIIQFNQAALIILGLSEEQLLGKTSIDPSWKATKRDGSTFPGCEHPAMVALATKKPVYNTLMGIEQNLGSQKWIRINAVPFLSPDNIKPALRVICTFADVTEELNLERAIESERAKATLNAKLASLGEMSAGIAHEINNPLAIISGSISLLLKFVNDPDRLSKKVETIQKSIDRISKIINGLRKFSRSADKVPYSKHDLSGIVKEVVVLTEAKSKRHSTPITFNSQTQSMILCNEVEIEQVLVNLINNAIDAVKNLPEKWVKIVIVEDQNSVILRITDSGPGIPKEVREKLFQPFFTTKKVGEGTGLGLSIVKGILDEHKAKIRFVESISHTCFEVQFSKAEIKIDAA